MSKNQYWNSSISSDYTSLFINLIDNYNELNNWFGIQKGQVNDQVSGFRIYDLETKVLKHAYGLSSLSQYLKANKPISSTVIGPTDAQIDLLLSYY